MFFAGACSSGDSPEAQVRALLAQGEAAAEKKESAVLRHMVSEKYSDSQGQDKKAIDAILRYYFLRRAGLPVSVVFGARRRGDGIGGHAWLTLNGAPYHELPEHYREFAVMFAYPSPLAHAE